MLILHSVSPFCSPTNQKLKKDALKIYFKSLEKLLLGFLHIY